MGLFTKKSSVKNTKDEKDIKEVKAVNKGKEVKDEILIPESQTSAKKDAVKTAPARTAKGQAGESYRLLLAPKISEKAAYLASQNVYVFEVPVNSEKIEIAKAVQSLYGVKVIGVRTARMAGKKIYRGRKVGRRNNTKKAFVCVKRGQTIDLYEGV